MSNMSKSVLTQYDSPLRKETGAFNLMSYIKDPAKRDRLHLAKQAITSIRVRRIMTDELFPYDASTFITWYYNDGQKKDPVTKENLDYIEPRVEFKNECLMYPDREYLMDALRSVEIQNMMALSFLQNCETLENYPKDFVLPLRLTTTMQVLEKIGYLHNGFDVLFFRFAKTCFDSAADDSAREILKTKNPRCACFRTAPFKKCPKRHKSWLMRTSEQSAIMKHASILTFSRVEFTDSKPVIRHARFIYIDGIGWYMVPDAYFQKQCVNASFIFLSQLTIDHKSQMPLCVTLVDLIEHFRIKHDLKYCDLLSRSDFRLLQTTD